MDELDGVYAIAIPTNLVQAKELSSENHVLKTCRLELIELNKISIVAQGYYVPNSHFGKMMKEMRCGVFLAYGQKRSDVKWLLNVVGYSRLLSCLVTDLEEVVWYTN
jgi:hypothetical protein